MISQESIKNLFNKIFQNNTRAKLWVPPGQFNSPIPNIEEILQREKEIFDIVDKDVPGINLNENQQIELLERLLKHFPTFQSTYLHKNHHHLRFKLNGNENIFFSYIDAVILWGMILHFNPANIIEIGSGYSSALMLDLKEHLYSDPLQLTFIEMFPERLFSLLKENDRHQTKIITEPMQQVSLNIYSQLTENDILFIDSSHVSKTGSDVNHIFFSILPRLKKGVLIHFHDVFFPFEYRKDWVLEGRSWNEAYLCRAFLMYNDEFEPIFFNSFMEYFHSEYFAELYKHFPEKEGASLWLRKK